MAQSDNVFETYATTSKSMFDFWVSFFPTAPMFGVEWRFGDLTPSAAPVSTKPAKRAETPDVTPAKPKTAPKAEAPKAAVPKVVTPTLAAAEAPVAKPKAVKSQAEASEVAKIDPVTEAPKVAAKTAEPEAVTKTPKAVAKPTAPTKPVLLSERPDSIDALTEIKGVGPGLEKQLHALGIYTFDQLIDLNDAQLEWLDDNLKAVKGRCIRDDWTGQAKALKG